MVTVNKTPFSSTRYDGDEPIFASAFKDIRSQAGLAFLMVTWIQIDTDTREAFLYVKQKFQNPTEVYRRIQRIYYHIVDNNLLTAISETSSMLTGEKFRAGSDDLFLQQILQLIVEFGKNPEMSEGEFTDIFNRILNIES